MIATPMQEKLYNVVDSHIEAGKRLLVLLYGSVRAGKTHGAAYAMVKHSKERSGMVYIIGAYTAKQVWTILAPRLQDAANEYGLDYSEHKSVANPHIIIGDNLFLVTGGKDDSRAKAIQGVTAAGLLLDEIPNLDRTFMHQCEARTSAKGALRIYTANKPSPYHWTTRYYYNRVMEREIRGVLIEAKTDENPFVDADYIDERLDEYDSATAASFMHNKFALPPSLYPINAGRATKDDELLFTVYGSDGFKHTLLGVSRGVEGVIIQEKSFGASLEGNPEKHVTKVTPILLPRPQQMLIRRLRKARLPVKVYDERYAEWKTETSQRVLESVFIDVESEMLLESIRTYSGAMTRDAVYIPTIDAACAYIRKKGYVNNIAV